MVTALPNNLQISQLLSGENVRLEVATFDDEVTFVVDSNIQSDLVYQTSRGRAVEVSLTPDLKLQSITTRDRGIRIKSVNGDGLSVVVVSEEVTSADKFLVLPLVHLPDMYEYYAVSVPRAQIIAEEEELQEPSENSAFIIVASEYNTLLSLTVSQAISIGGDYIEKGTPFDITLNERETLYISDIDDLSGSRVLANKPIAFISGHECGNLPANQMFCDQMFEQIPPTSTWGRTFYTAPLSTRKEMENFKFVASKNNTNIDGVCGPLVQRISVAEGVSAGDVVDFNVSSGLYCQFTSDKPVLLMQFSFGGRVDNVSNADPFMMMIPPVEQYRSQYLISTFESQTTTEQYFINVVMEAQFERTSLLIDGSSITQDWSDIPCSSDMRSTCAYGVQVSINVSDAAHVISHEDASATFGVNVYSFGYRVGQGYTAGVNQRPVACKYVVGVFGFCLQPCIYDATYVQEEVYMYVYHLEPISATKRRQGVSNSA